MGGAGGAGGTNGGGAGGAGFTGGLPPAELPGQCCWPSLVKVTEPVPLASSAYELAPAIVLAASAATTVTGPEGSARALAEVDLLHQQRR